MYLSKLLEPEPDTAFKVNLVNRLFEKLNNEEEGSRQRDDTQDLVIELVDELLQGNAKELEASVEKIDLHLCILEMLERTADHAAVGKVSDCSVQIKLCNVIKKTLSWSDSSTAVVSVYLQAVKDRAEWFNHKQTLLTKGQIAQGLQQFEFEMLQEMAETLLVCIGFINDDVLLARAEENLYALISSGIEPLQKAAFVVLKYIYENFVLPVEHATTEAQELAFLIEESKHNHAEESKDTETQKKYRTSKAFQNVPSTLINLIENAPNVLASNEE